MTLVELMAACAIAVMVVASAATLLVASQRQWIHTYNDANKGINFDATQIMISFGSVGRKSNKSDYVVYKLVNGSYVKAPAPTGDPFGTIAGDAIEFRYWDKPLSADLVDPKKTATAYAFFYLDGTDLKVDEGPYDSTTKIGGVDASGRRMTGSNINTRTLAENVTQLVFNHVSQDKDGNGNGCVRLEAVLTDPCDRSTVTVKAATLMRNVWP